MAADGPFVDRLDEQQHLFHIEGGRMSETAEGIGGRKWSLLRAGDAWTREEREKTTLGDDDVCLMEGKAPLASLTDDGNKVRNLLATAPQMWETANAMVKACYSAQAADPTGVHVTAEVIALANMVAKSVGKNDWKEVAQA